MRSMKGNQATWMKTCRQHTYKNLLEEQERIVLYTVPGIPRNTPRRPTNATVIDTLGWTLFRQGKIDEALPLLRKGVAGMPANPAHHYHLGVVLIKSGDVTGGRKQLEMALRISGNFDGAAKAREILGKKGSD